MSEAGGEAAGGGGRGADTELKTKTPHVNVGKFLLKGKKSSQVLRRKVPKSFQRPTQGFFKPPEPPAVYMLWQHRKMETFHLARPDFKRVFMCNRYIGPSHSKDDMSIRYDTPVCRDCAAAVKE